MLPAYVLAEPIICSGEAQSDSENRNHLTEDTAGRAEKSITSVSFSLRQEITPSTPNFSPVFFHLFFRAPALVRSMIYLKLSLFAFKSKPGQLGEPNQTNQQEHKKKKERKPAPSLSVQRDSFDKHPKTLACTGTAQRLLTQGDRSNTS